MIEQTTPELRERWMNKEDPPKSGHDWTTLNFLTLDKIVVNYSIVDNEILNLTGWKMLDGYKKN